MPIELELFDFALPDENSMHAMMYYYESIQVELYQGRNLDAAYHRFAHRQRIELVHAYDEQSVHAPLLGRFSGADFTPRRAATKGRGEVHGQRHRARFILRTGHAFDDRAQGLAPRRRVDDVPARAVVPRALTFLYMPDEPRPPEYPRILHARRQRALEPGTGPRLAGLRDQPSTSRRWIGQSISGARGPQGSTSTRGAPERARGRQYWFYNGGRPAGGAIAIDAPATDARAIDVGRVQARGAPVYFYWHACTGATTRRSGGERNQNVWADSITFDNRGQPNKPIDYRVTSTVTACCCIPAKRAAPRPGSRYSRSDRDDAAGQPSPRTAGPSVSDDGAKGSG